jgi:acetyltransferase-like isoleucine patch superfamily enzyme
LVYRRSPFRVAASFALSRREGRMKMFSCVGDYVELYNLDANKIGRHSVVSQRSYLCTGSHHYQNIAFPYKTAPIVIGDQVWIASDVFITRV